LLRSPLQLKNNFISSSVSSNARHHREPDLLAIRCMALEPSAVCYSPKAFKTTKWFTSAQTAAQVRYEFVVSLTIKLGPVYCAGVCLIKEAECYQVFKFLSAQTRLSLRSSDYG
jgi:hypothetical protein